MPRGEAELRAGKDRSGQILFIDARELGYMRTRTERDLTPEDRARSVQAYHNWRGDGDVEYEDVLGFCKAATIDDLEQNGWVLTPGRYVDATSKEEDSEPFAEKMTWLNGDLRAQFAESDCVQAVTKANLERLDYDE